MKKIFVLIITIFVASLLVCCNINNVNKDNEEDFTNPGDYLGGGGEVEIDEKEYDTEEIEEQKESYIIEVFDNEDETEVPDEIKNVDLSELSEDYKIEKSGSYYFTGSTTYKIVLGKKEIEIHLYFDNATLDSIFADKKPTSTIITLIGNNTLTGVESDTNEDSKGTLYVKNDLVINGSGSLNISSGDGKNGIHATGTLKIIDAAIIINAGKHGVRGNTAVICEGCNLDITTLDGDGIQTDNEQEYDEDTLLTASKELGYIVLQDSNITINAKDDGIQASTSLYVKSGELNIITNGGAPATVSERSKDSASGKGLKVGLITFIDQDEKETEITDESYYSLFIEGGIININSNDDAIHSNGSMVISAGTINITTGDDAIHSESVLIINGGTIDISKCYEGIESSKIEIYDGDITVVASDDGINAADGTSNTPGRSNSNCYIMIKGGNIKVNSIGDGIDSNGTLLISGGLVYVDGPTSGMDAALDSDGGILINGGTVVAVGSLGMVETPGKNSTQNCVSYALNSTIAEASNIVVKDANGKEILNFTTAKKCQSIIMSTSEFVVGGTYTVYINGVESKTFTITQTITTIGSTKQGGPGGQPGGPGGWGHGGR